MRITTGNRCYYGLQHLFKSRTGSRIVKIKIYKTILKPIVMFGCEAWSMTEKGKKKGKGVPLHAMEAHGGERRYSSYSYLTSATRWG
jgi:hypothetical protein